jgi:Fur family peroxide stress response transcriptional regulator
MHTPETLPTNRLAALVEKLKAGGHRITPQRVAILEAVMNSPQHPSAEQVYIQVLAQYPMISLATVYKTLDLMKAEGEVIELGFGSEGSRYDGARPYPHPHLICSQCRRIIDLEPEYLPGLPSGLAKNHGFTDLSQRVDYYGLCPDCQAQRQANQL